MPPKDSLDFFENMKKSYIQFYKDKTPPETFEKIFGTALQLNNPDSIKIELEKNRRKLFIIENNLAKKK